MNDVRVRGPGVLLHDLARELKGRVELLGDAKVVVFGVQQDSRRIERGDLFVVRQGAHANGADFVAEAQARGAVAFMLDRNAEVAPGTSCVLVEDVRASLAHAAAAAYGHPSF